MSIGNSLNSVALSGTHLAITDLPALVTGTLLFADPSGAISSGPAAAIVGSQGPVGPTGPQGSQGGSWAVGATGAQGLAGAQGPPGGTGGTGATGAQGSTGTEGAIGMQGATGTQGATGSLGSTGADGPQGGQGAQGSTGAEGPTGAQGLTGPPGSTGVQGSTGADGPQGAQGPTGTEGLPGSQGSQGAQGPAGPAFFQNFSVMNATSLPIPTTFVAGVAQALGAWQDENSNDGGNFDLVTGVYSVPASGLNTFAGSYTLDGGTAGAGEDPVVLGLRITANGSVILTKCTLAWVVGAVTYGSLNLATAFRLVAGDLVRLQVFVDADAVVSIHGFTTFSGARLL